MALYHDATVTPSKPDLLAAWVPTQSWCPHPEMPVEVIGAYRFDDPEGQVGMETALVRNADAVLHVPMTYRAEPLEGNDDGLICEMHHTALGTRWVYDGLTDDRLVTMLAAVSITGQGEALGMVSYDGVWHIAPTNVRLRGGGWGLKRVSVDGFVGDVPESGSDESLCRLRNDVFEMVVHRQVAAGSQPELGLTATWPDQPDPMVLTELNAL